MVRENDLVLGVDEFNSLYQWNGLFGDSTRVHLSVEVPRPFTHLDLVKAKAVGDGSARRLPPPYVSLGQGGQPFFAVEESLLTSIEWPSGRFQILASLHQL